MLAPKGLKKTNISLKDDLKIIYIEDTFILLGTTLPYDDIINGLAFCIHGLWGNQIEVKSYTCDGNNYSGTLVFTLYAHFGLDATDVEKYGFLAGFRAWYILQHNKEYEGEHKPFVAVMQFEVPFSGTIN